MNYLFVGGPFDGQRKEVPLDLLYEKIIGNKKHRYFLDKLSTGVYFYSHGSLMRDEVMQKLIENYNPKKS